MSYTVSYIDQNSLKSPSMMPDGSEFPPVLPSKTPIPNRWQFAENTIDGNRSAKGGRRLHFKWVIIYDVQYAII